MSGLLFKEFYENRKMLIFTYAFVLFGVVLMIGSFAFGFTVDERLVLLSSLGMQAVIMLFTGTVQTMIFQYDESRLWSGFVSSTPLTAGGQVKSKYLFVLLTSTISISVCLIADIINCAVNEAGSVFQLVALIFWLQLLFNAIEIPFVIRFGAKKGNNLRAVIFISILFIVIVYALFGDISMFGSDEDFYDFALKLIKGEVGMQETLWLNALLPYVSVTLYILSYKLSCKLYPKGAEGYER